MNAVAAVRWRAVATAAVAALVVAAIGGTLTDVGPWYQALAKPSWTPPDAAFGVVWTVIFSLAAAAGVVGWPRASTAARREWLIGLFCLNGFLNILWTLLFFRLRRPDWGLIEVVGLWLSVGMLIVFFARFSRASALLLAPYLVWVSVAAALNLDIVTLNAPFV